MPNNRNQHEIRLRKLLCDETDVTDEMINQMTTEGIRKVTDFFSGKNGKIRSLSIDDKGYPINVFVEKSDGTLLITSLYGKENHD